MWAQQEQRSPVMIVSGAGSLKNPGKRGGAKIFYKAASKGLPRPSNTTWWRCSKAGLREIRHEAHGPTPPWWQTPPLPPPSLVASTNLRPPPSALRHLGPLRPLDGPWWINGPDAPCSLPHKAHSQRLNDMDIAALLRPAKRLL
jgi:hypothetical protein